MKKQRYSLPIDIYAFGVIAFQLVLCDKRLAEEYGKLIKFIEKYEQIEPKDTDSVFYLLLSSLRMNPQSRQSALSLCSCRFLQSANETLNRVLEPIAKEYTLRFPK